ncbi:PREDICTED: pectinesterase-like [Tarenaya hassleriana]|uniref:pectinesterase-like n=1 Tax=Tarenaya hassleriana TaxID=28532 RepID=UPI00053C2902|nr:PREDICTED: pectinesterase-like [Tarenaya hassleriana]
MASQTNKNLLFLFGFLVITAISVAGESKPNKNTTLSASSKAVVRSSCSSTPLPDLCYFAVASIAGQNITSQKDVIKALLDVTAYAVKESYSTVKGLLITGIGLSPRANTAVNDCVENIEVTLEDLQGAAAKLLSYPNGGTGRNHAGDLKTLVSSAITNQESCLEGFSYDIADMVIRSIIYTGEVYIQRLCGIALALIKNMTDTDIANSRPKARPFNKRKLEEATMAAATDKDGWPCWLSADDRRLLQSKSVQPNVVVAADGTGDFTTVGEAVEAAPKKRTERYVIKIKAGVYRENVNVPSNKMNLMFVGDGRTKTFITGDRSVGGNEDMTTFRSATVAAVGEGFMARDITFENTAGPSNDQAVALRVGSDKSAFYRCNISAYQDTLYVHSKRQFFVKCHVSGTVDFIFGNAAVVFQDCDIHARRPNPEQRNMVTAQGRTDPNQNTGIVIQNCRIGATLDLREAEDDFPTYLGRPWKRFSRTVVMQSDISDVIRPEGWHLWNGNFALDTLIYREYANRGPGANTEFRVNWKGFEVITDPEEAEEYTADRFIDGADWLSETGFPFNLAL